MPLSGALCGLIIVALRKESVDRNLYYGDDLTFSDGVALRKESVDRNFNTVQIEIVKMQSLSARRAWIEMETLVPRQYQKNGRSPQGERG